MFSQYAVICFVSLIDCVLTNNTSRLAFFLTKMTVCDHDPQYQHGQWCYTTTLPTTFGYTLKTLDLCIKSIWPRTFGWCRGRRLTSNYHKGQ